MWGWHVSGIIPPSLRRYKLHCSVDAGSIAGIEINHWEEHYRSQKTHQGTRHGVASASCQPMMAWGIVFCSCKKLCNAKRCTCKQHGLPCSDVCTECRGASCSNSVRPDVPDDCMDWSHCAMLAHQQIVVLSFKGPTRLSEDMSANYHACSMSWSNVHTYLQCDVRNFKSLK